MTRQAASVVCAVAVALSLPLAAQHQHQHQPDQHDHHLEHRFDDPERYSRSFDDPERDGWQMPDRVLEALNLRPDSLVADIGAGTGYFTMRLAKVVPQGMVYAVDVEPSMLDFIAQRAGQEGVANVRTVRADATHANLPAPVDVVLIVNTYHHLPERPAYFARLRESLRPGGRIAIVDYHKESPSGPRPEFRFEASQIISEMQKAGYQLDAQHDFLPRQHFLVFRPE